MSWRVTVDQTLRAAEMGAKLAFERVRTGLVFNPMRADLRADPHPFYRELRERDPIHRSWAADGWVLSRHRDVQAVLGDRRFSSDERNLRRWPKLMRRRRHAGLPDPYAEDRASMLRVDAPDHTRLRGLVSKAFTPRAVERMRPRVEALVSELLAPFEPGQPMELIADFASPLPVTIIAEMLGVPAEDHARFRAWSDEVIRTLGDGTVADHLRADAAMQELGGYLVAGADARRRAPREDLLTGLVQAEERGDQLSDNELATMCVLLLVAGNETTTKLIANAVVALLRNPEQLELLRREPKRIAGAVDELLRYDGPVQLTSRMVLADEEFQGRRLRRGQQVVLLLAAANRDPEAFPDPERLDVARENVRHLAFGHGAHFCLGAQLARLETALGLEALLPRFPRLRFGDAPVVWGDNTVLRGPTRLPLLL
jgi:cytochrome P450